MTTHKFKEIRDYTAEELIDAIQDAISHCAQFYPGEDSKVRAYEPLNFWRIMNGVDAYMEQRRRKEESDSFVIRKPGA